MDPLKRNNPGVQATNHEDRIQALERRILPPPGLPWCASSANWTTETLTVGNFVNMGLQSASTSDTEMFAHLPLVDGWVENDTNDIDGCIVILEPGLYDMFVSMSGFTSVPSNTQSVDLQIRTIQIDDPLGTPTPSGSWLASQNVGTHSAPPSLAFGSTILSNTDWVTIRLFIGGGSTFATRGVKPYLALSGAGSNLSGVSVQMLIIQVCPLLCDSGNSFPITDEGIPSTWENPCP